jgi:sialic acid synthase SpsE
MSLNLPVMITNVNQPERVLEIDGRLIGRHHPVYFVADIAANHDGDLVRAKELIHLAADAGADAAKFQHFQASTIVSDHGFKSLKTQLSHQANWKDSVFDVYKAASVNLEWTETLKETCKKAGIAFFTTPYSLDLVDFIDSCVPAYKIGSGDITWLEMIEQVASKQKPYFLATGASTADEVNSAVRAALSINPKLALMQCNTNYTASLDNFKYIQLNVLQTYRSMYPDIVLGLSDHTPGHATVLGAVALGARIIEKHFTDDINRNGPDHAFSMDPRTWREMVERSRELENALGNGIKEVEDNEKDTVIVQRRSLRAKEDLFRSHVIKTGDFVALRPCPSDALTPAEIKKIVGRTLLRDICAGEYLRAADLA